MKSVQICAYADDVAIISRRITSLKEVTGELSTEANSRGLEMNENKTKYMEIKRMPSRGKENFEVEEFSFENVEEFTYLGSQ